MTRTQKFLIVVIYTIMFSGAGFYAYHEYTAYLADEASQTLRSCNLNPVNGATMEVR